MDRSRVLASVLLGVLLTVAVYYFLIISISVKLQVLGYIVLGMFYLYVPLQAYARRVGRKLGWEISDKKRLITIAIAYFIWYPPILIVFFVVWLSEQYSTRPQPIWCVIGLSWLCVGYFYFELKNKITSTK